MNIQNRTLFIADNLDIMRGIDSETIDLIYLDPPFNSKKQYKAPIGSPAEGAEFKDIWTDEDIKHEWHGEIAETNEELYQIIQASEVVYDKSMKIYLTAMAVRLFEMRRILKPMGSIYLHCDPTASHYLKLVMDSLFGKQNFRNEIVWYYKNASRGKSIFAKSHDLVLWYSISSDFIFNRDDILMPYESGMTKWRYKQKGKKPPKGKTPDDVLTLPAINTMAKERTGWPTQKPLALLEHIIKASSNKNDVVLDPFCGCATACVAAELLQRQWIGIDISPSAEDITKYRLSRQLSDWNFDSKVIVATEPPTRTDDTPTDVQTHLPPAKVHKHALYGIQEGRCNGCQYFLPYHVLTIDHITPQSRGGTDVKENLQLLCHSCNATKGDDTQDYLIDRLIEKGILR